MKNQFRVKPIKLSSFKKFLIEGYDDDEDDDDDVGGGGGGFQNEYEDLFKKGYITKENGRWQEGYYFNDFLDWWSKTKQNMPFTDIYKKITEYGPAAKDKPSPYDIRKIIQKYANKSLTQFGGGIGTGFYGITLPDNVSELTDDELFDALKQLNPKESDSGIDEVIKFIEKGEKEYGSRKIYDNTLTAKAAAREQQKIFAGAESKDIRQGRIKNPSAVAGQKMNIVDTWTLKSFRAEHPNERQNREAFEEAPRPLDEIYADLASEGVQIEDFEGMTAEEVEETLKSRIDSGMTNKARALYIELEAALNKNQSVRDSIKRRGAEGKPEKYLIKMDFGQYSLALSRRIFASERFVENNGYDPAFIPFYATDQEIQSIKDAIDPPGKTSYKKLKHADFEDLNERARRRQAALKIITVIRGRGPSEEEEAALYSNETVSQEHKKLAEYFTNMNRALTLAEKEKNKQYQARIREDRDHPDWNDTFDNDNGFELGKSRWPGVNESEAASLGRESTTAAMGMSRSGNIRLTSIGPNTNFAALPLNATGLHELLGSKAGFTFKGDEGQPDNPSRSHNEFFGDAYFSKFDKQGIINSAEDDAHNTKSKRGQYWRFLLDPFSLAYHFDPRTWWHHRVLMPLTNQQKKQVEDQLDKQNIKSIHDLNGGYGRLPDLKDPYFLYAWNDFMRKQKKLDKLGNKAEDYEKQAKETLSKAYPQGYDENDEYLRYPLAPSELSLKDEVKELCSKYVSGTYLPEYVTRPTEEMKQRMKDDPNYDPKGFFSATGPSGWDPESKVKWASPSEREKSFRSEVFKKAMDRIEDEKRRQNVFNVTVMSTIEDGNSILTDDLPTYDEDGNPIKSSDPARFTPVEQEHIRKSLEGGMTRSHNKISQRQQRIMNSAEKRKKEKQSDRANAYTHGSITQAFLDKKNDILDDEHTDDINVNSSGKIGKNSANIDSPERLEDIYGDRNPYAESGEAGRIDTFGSNFYDWELYPFGDPDVPRPRDLTDRIDYDESYDKWGNYLPQSRRDPYADIAQYGFDGDAYNKISGNKTRRPGQSHREKYRHYDKSGKFMAARGGPNNPKK